MRKAIFFTLLLLLQTAVMGQTGHQLRYWFDGDHDKLQTMQVATGESRQLIDVTHLATGFHRIYIQTMDSSRVLGLPVVHEFYKAAPESTDAVYFYWFDGNHNETKKVQAPIGRWRQPIDVQQLPTGFHEIFMQVVDGSGTYSSPVSHSFYKCTTDSEETTYSCWFDEDSATTVIGKCNNGIIWLDVNKMSDGFHTLYMQVHNQASSQPVERAFIKVPQTENVDYLTCMLMVDDTLFHEERIASTRGVLNFDFDVSSLSQGAHLLQAFVVTPTGAATNIEERFFIRAVSETEIAGLKCCYVVDDAKDSVQAGTYSNGVFHFDIDVSSLEDGLHNLNYMLIGDNGVTTEMRTAFFTKIPVGGNGITEYHYWLNEDDSIKVVKRLEKRMNPLQITSLLPVESVPLRSKLFHFEIKDGAPMIFAKNIFNMRFFDASGRMTDCSREYIDYNVSQKVEGVTSIARGKDCKTFTAPGKNEIEWMGIEMQTGDTLAIKSNAACTIQIFSPSGKEVYAVSGAESVTFDGIHAWEDGKYYIAVHDVTATKKEVSISTLQLDKYVVLDYTPKNAGVAPSMFVMNLLGNGYDKLVRAELSNGNDKLVADTVSCADYGNARLIFTFKNYDYQLGKYDLTLYFNDGDAEEMLTVEDAVTFEEPIFGEIKVSYETRQRMASPYPVTIKLTNTGNVGYSLVPVYIAYDNSKGINNLFFNDFLVEISKEMHDNGLKAIYDTDNLFGKGKSGVVVPAILASLSSGETIELTPAFETDGNYSFNIYTMIGKPLLGYSQNNHNKSRTTERALPGTTCIPDLCDMVGDILPELSNDATDCTCSLAEANIRMFANAFAAQWNKAEADRWAAFGSDFEALGLEWPYRRIRLQNPYGILRDVLGDCISNRQLNMVADAFNDYMDELTENQDCNPTPQPIEILTPCEPNDIVGFAAESGSRFVPSSFENVHYTIRSENDPVFATAAAHTIIVTDTLDGSKFDLSAFAATSVKIGSVMMELNGEKSFVKTMDLRPAIDVVAEVTLDYNEAEGIATWTILSLDPMTMEPTEDPMQGALPVNNGGNGEAEFGFNIKLKSALVDGTEVDNKASIIFDNETAVVTPVWRNIIDNVKPTSAIAAIETINDSVIEVSWEGKDVGSGMWKYDLYVQPGNVDEWIKFPCDTLRTSCRLSYVDNLSMGFCVVAIDSAGNVEDKKLTREAVFMRGTKRGDANMDSIVSISDVVATVNNLLGRASGIFNFDAADVNQDKRITIGDVVGIVNIVLNPDDYIVKYVKRRNGVALATEYISMEDVLCDDNEGVTLPIELFNDNDYAAFQMDFEIPEGLNVVSVSLGDRAADSHSVAWERLSDGKMRVVAYSTDNVMFSGNAGNILNLNMIAEMNVSGKLSISNIRFASPDGNETLLEDCCSLLDISGVTGIGRTVDDALRVYTVDGVLAIECSKPMQMAVYSVNGTLFKMLSLAEGKNICNTIPAGTYIVSGVTVVVNPQSE